MPPSAKCSICSAFLSSQHLFIKDIPAGSQYFSRKINYPNLNAYLSRCSECGHIQLLCKPPLYYKEVIRSIDISPEMTSYRTNQFSNIKKEFFNGDSDIKVLEIGSGSGGFLRLLSTSFKHIFGTEHSFKSDKTNLTSNSNVKVLSTHPDRYDFFEIITKNAPYDFICCFSYLEHLPSPSVLFSNISKVLSEDGVLLIEVPNTELILSNGLLNEIIPDHLHYFTHSSLTRLGHLTSFRIHSFLPSWHNYISSAYFKHDNHLIQFDKLETQYSSFTTRINNYLASIQDDAIIYVWGAGHQSLFTISTTDLSTRVSCIIDSSSLKQEKFTPGTHLPIFHPSLLNSSPPDYLFIACAGYNSEVIRLTIEMKLRCQLVVLNGIDIEVIDK